MPVELEVASEHLSPFRFHNSVNVPFSSCFQPNVAKVMTDFYVHIEECRPHHERLQEAAPEEAVKPNYGVEFGLILKADAINIITHNFFRAEIPVT